MIKYKHIKYKETFVIFWKESMADIHESSKEKKLKVFSNVNIASRDKLTLQFGEQSEGGIYGKMFVYLLYIYIFLKVQHWDEMSICLKHMYKSIFSFSPFVTVLLIHVLDFYSADYSCLWKLPEQCKERFRLWIQTAEFGHSECEGEW